MPIMESYQFVVDEKPYCIADWDLRKKNTDFLKGIDTGYFEHVALQQSNLLDGDEQKYAALTLRQAYSHALETFFALLSAFIQAPQCPLGWMLKYENRDLYSMVRKLIEHRPVMNRLAVPTRWDSLSSAIHQFRLEDSEKERRIKEGFAALWERLARGFIDRRASAEYNSIKHGLRIRPGGLSVSIGLQPGPGVRAPREAMQSLGGSAFGSSYFVAEQVGEHKLGFRPHSHHRNWNPQRFAGILLLLDMSIRNVVSGLRGLGGEDWSTLEFVWPEDVSDFDKPWSVAVPIEWSNFDTAMGGDDVDPCTKDEVLAEYSKTAAADSVR